MSRSRRNRSKNKQAQLQQAARQAPAAVAPSRGPEAPAPQVTRTRLPRTLAALDADYGALLRMRNVRWLIVIAVVVGALIFGFYLSEVFVPLLVALGVAYILNPLVDGLEKRGLSRTRAVLLIFVGFIASLLCFGVWFAASVIADLRQIGNEIGGVVADVRQNQRQWVEQWNRNAPEFARVGDDFRLDTVLEVVKDKVAPQRAAVGTPEEKQATAALAGARAQFLAQFQMLDANRNLKLDPGELDAAAIAALDTDKNGHVSTDEWYVYHGAPRETSEDRVIAPEARAVAEGVFGVVSGGLVWILSLVLFVTLVPIYTWYFMVGLDDIGDKVQTLLPGIHRQRIMKILREIDGMAKAFFRGRLMVVLIVGVLSTILFSAFGVKYAFVLGLMSGLGVLIPYFGFVAGLLPAFLLMAIQPQPSWAAIGAMSALFVLIQILEQYVLTPKLLGNAVELHPVTLLVGVFVMSALFGFFGALLAVPLTAIAKTLGREFVLPYFKSLADEKPPPAPSS